MKNKLVIESLKQTIIELRDEKYQQEKNGLAEAGLHFIKILEEAINFTDSYTMIKVKDIPNFQSYVQANFIRVGKETYVDIVDNERCSLEKVISDYYQNKQKP